MTFKQAFVVGLAIGAGLAITPTVLEVTGTLALVVLLTPELWAVAMFISAIVVAGLVLAAIGSHIRQGLLPWWQERRRKRQEPFNPEAWAAKYGK